MVNEKTDIKGATQPEKFKLYDSAKGEFLGRTGMSWLKIGIFYLAYFSFLAGLFMASITIMQNSQSKETPKLQTRLNIPGLHFFPNLANAVTEQKDRIKVNNKVNLYWDTAADAKYATNHEIYAKMINQAMEPYSDNEIEVDGAFDFDTSTLGECAPTMKDGKPTGNYGWDTQKPCIFLRLNRVIGWTPVGLFEPEGDIFKMQFNTPTKKMERDAVYVRCRREPDLLSGETIETITQPTFKYFGGTDGNLDKKYFPYQGKLKIIGDKAIHEKYESPIVAVQLSDLTEGMNYKITCNALARNIIVKNRESQGSITFNMQMGGEPGVKEDVKDE